MSVELGFFQNSEPWEIESRFFPSKAGGKPAWLSLDDIPNYDKIKCGNCEQTMIFLCQIYAPFEEEGAGEHNFHRTVFIFVCNNGSCGMRNCSKNVLAYRSCIPRENKFYSPDAADDRPDPNFKLSNLAQLCNYCGCGAEKKCGQCKKVLYCCKDHQIKDWKEKHKKECKGGEISEEHSKALFTEWEIVTEIECLEDSEVNIDEELKKFEQLQLEGKSGTLDEASIEDLDAHATTEKDKTFAKFKKRTSENPDQVVRYDRGGEPLWIASEPLPGNIPHCEYCGSPREFEFQIMPQILTLLKETNIDFGVIAVYTCKNSCKGDDVNSYKKEFVFKQDVSLDNE